MKKATDEVNMEEIYKDRGSIHCYPGTNILINKLNIKDGEKLSKYEAKITAAKSLALKKNVSLLV